LWWCLCRARSGPPDTNVLCGTCPTVCYSDGGSNCPPGTPPQGQGQNKGGGHPSGYYYFFTSGGSGRRAGPSGFALVLVMALAAGFHE
jgi:hypothetical protein